MSPHQLFSIATNGGELDLFAATVLGKYFKAHWEGLSLLRSDAGQPQAPWKAEDVERTLTRLLEYLQTTEDSLPALVFALGETHDPRAVPVLRSLLEENLNDDVFGLGYYAIQALSKCGGSECLPDYQNAQRSQSVEIAKMARRFAQRHTDSFFDLSFRPFDGELPARNWWNLEGLVGLHGGDLGLAMTEFGPIEDRYVACLQTMIALAGITELTVGGVQRGSRPASEGRAPVTLPDPLPDSVLADDIAPFISASLRGEMGCELQTESIDFRLWPVARMNIQVRVSGDPTPYQDAAISAGIFVDPMEAEQW